MVQKFKIFILIILYVCIYCNSDASQQKIMVFIDEKFNGIQNKPGYTETEIIISEMLMDSGIECVDWKLTRTLYETETKKVLSAMNGTIVPEFRDYLIKTLGVTTVIIGTTNTSQQGQRLLQKMGASDMKSVSAIVRLKAIDLKTGSIIASASRSESSIHVNLNVASKRAIEKILRTILGKKDNSGKFVRGKFIDEIMRNYHSED